MPVRLGLRAYGHWRGTEMREAHHALGLDIDVRNLILCRDSASVFIVKDRRSSRSGVAPRQLSITAVAAISTRNSGLTSPACTQARAGGFSGKYVP